METFASLGPRAPAVAPDTAAVILAGWSLQHDLDYQGNAIFCATVRPHASGHMAAPSVLILAIRPTRYPVVVSGTMIDHLGHHQPLATARVPGMIADIARSKVREVFAP